MMSLIHQKVYIITAVLVTVCYFLLTDQWPPPFLISNQSSVVTFDDEADPNNYFSLIRNLSAANKRRKAMTPNELLWIRSANLTYDRCLSMQSHATMNNDHLANFIAISEAFMEREARTIQLLNRIRE